MYLAENSHQRIGVDRPPFSGVLRFSSLRLPGGLSGILDPLRVISGSQTPGRI